MSVGTTRTTGSAGPAIDLSAFLAGDLTEMGATVLLNNIGWEYGTEANQVNVIYADTIPIGDGDTIAFNLNTGAPGSYVDIFERALTLTAVKLVYVKNNSSDATLEILGIGATTLSICKGDDDIIKIKPGGTFMWTDPSAAGTDCETDVSFRLVHDGTGSDSMNVDMIVMGLD